MPRDFKSNEYVTLAFRKDSPVLAHLKEEARAKKPQSKKTYVAAYIAEVLEKRDEQLYGGNAYTFSSEQLSVLVESAVKAALSGVNIAPPIRIEPSAMAETPLATIEEEAQELANVWGDDEWDDS